MYISLNYASVNVYYNIYAISINWLCLLAFYLIDFLFFFFIFFVGECLKQKRENIISLYKLDNKTDFTSSFFLLLAIVLT